MTLRSVGTRLSRQATLATLVVAALLPISWTVPAASATTGVTAAGSIASAAARPLTVSLTAITPTFAVPQAPITITGSVRNSGGVPIDLPVARALIGERPLTNRQSVSDWAASTSEQPLAEIARASMGKTLAPGAVAAFTLKVPASAVSRPESFAVLPLRVEVAGATSGTRSLGDVNTFLPVLASVKRYEPLSVAWLVPLTLDPDPALHGENGPARTAAWNRAVGPGSRLDQLIRGTENASVTWAIDPAILGPRETPPAAGASASPSQTPSATTSKGPDSPAAPDRVAEQTTALARRLKAAAPRHTLWSLPYSDPDLSALLPLASGGRVLSSLIGSPTSLDVAVDPARTDIAWPVDGILTPQVEAQLRRAFAVPGLAAAVTSSATLAGKEADATEASRKSSGGLPLLAYDESLSRTVAQTSSKATGTITIQRFLADSMALLGERPGTPDRSVLIAEPRTFAGDAGVLAALFAAVANAPWLTTTTTEQILADSRKLAPALTGLAEAVTPESPTAAGDRTAAPDPMSSGSSPLSAGRLANKQSTLAAIAGMGSILGDGGYFSIRWTDAQVQQLSTRWRGHAEGLTAIDAATRAAIRRVSRSVRVAPSSVNFFADRGVLQVTVVNDLGVPVHDVYLRLIPGQPRLRIEQQPGPLKIGADSRANARLQVTSLAAGLVSIKAVLTTRNGTPLGQNASVSVRVQPPSTWIYWALGGLAGLVLVLGTFRSLRRGSTRGSRPDAQELPLND